MVLQRGVPGWLRAQAVVPPESAPEGTLHTEDTGPRQFRDQGRTMASAVAAEILPLARQSELTLLIAGMVLSTQRTARVRSKRAGISQTRCLEEGRCQ